MRPTIELAKQPWQPWQRGLFIGAILGLIAQAALDLETFILVWNVITLAFFSSIVSIKVVAVFLGQFSRYTIKSDPIELYDLQDESLPVYTVQVPMYKEADVVAGMVESLTKLDYPKDKLDVQLLLEEDDHETINAVNSVGLPHWIKAVIVPDGTPRTKPRACNYGLDRAQGEYLVIFDAEDRPESDQLKKAVLAFRKLPEKVICLQARLNWYNGYQKLLTRCFTLEYSTWFDLYLPGLHAIGSPIPLGGTSNHFRIDELRKLGGWDAYNVTEDCDLGIRISLARKKIRILDSTTWEEAPIHLGAWLSQRSRWIKGYWQTLLVHTRNPFKTAWQLGPWKFFMLLNTVGGQVFSLMLMPICWAIILAWYQQRWDLWDPKEPWTLTVLLATVMLFLFNGYFVLIHLVAGIRRRYYRLVFESFLMPFYWLLMSIGAWRGFLQFFWAPFKWMKTSHGLLSEKEQEKYAQVEERNALGPVFTIIPFILGIIGLTWVTLNIPDYMKVQEQIRIANISLDGRYLEHERKINRSLFGHKDLVLECDLQGSQRPNPAYRALVYAKVNDGEWYQTLIETPKSTGNKLILKVPLDIEWQGKNENVKWGPWSTRHVISIGVRLFGDIEKMNNIAITHLRPERPTVPGALATEFHKTPQSVKRNQLFEAQFRLSRHYENPFDPKEIDVEGVFISPTGKQYKVPAYYAQDYSRNVLIKEHPYKVDIRMHEESLQTVGAPYWAVRFMPREAGTWRWKIIGKDHLASKINTSEKTLDVRPDNSSRGYMTVSKDKRHFEFENGEFFYPTMINLCWPRDSRTIMQNGFRMLNYKDGTLLMDDYVKRMQKNKINMGRIWMTPWWAGLEWNKNYPGFHGVGKYNLRNAWSLDHMMKDAQRRGVMIENCH